MTASRKLGHDFERLIARRIREHLGDESVKRGFQARDGAEAPDVICPGWWIECKYGARVDLEKAWNQACIAVGNRPLRKAIVWRLRGRQIFVTTSALTLGIPDRYMLLSMSLEDWLANYLTANV